MYVEALEAGLVPSARQRSDQVGPWHSGARTVPDDDPGALARGLAWTQPSPISARRTNGSEPSGTGTHMIATHGRWGSPGISTHWA